MYDPLGIGLSNMALYFSVFLLLSSRVLGSDICYWSQLRAGIVNDTLYMEGGELAATNFSSDGIPSTIDTTPKSTRYSLNLTTTFDVGPTKQKNLISFDNPDDMINEPPYTDGTLFVDEYEFYTYGGVPLTSDKSYANKTVLNYGVKSGYQGQTFGFKGLNSKSPLPDSVTNNVTNGAGVSILSEKLGFYFSGLHAPGWTGLAFATPSNLSQYMIQIDMSKPNAAVWKNLTIPNTIAPRMGAQLVWIPVSSQGLLVAIGGLNTTFDIWSGGLLEQNITRMNAGTQDLMKTLAVYDIANQQWYTQTTTADVYPKQLGQFCSVVAYPDDLSSFEIYIYGGNNGSATYSSDEVWILSLPAFRWFKVTDGNPTHARDLHYCAKPYPNQMFSVGGQNKNNGATHCLQQGTTVDVFDLNLLKWTGTYDPTSWSGYKVPKLIYDVIKGDENGGATLKADMPSGLAALFSTNYTKPLPKVVQYLPYKKTDNQTTTSTNTGGQSSSNAAAIGGGVGGGVGGLLIIGAIVWFLLRRRSRLRDRRSKAESETTYGNDRVEQWANGVPKSNASVTETEVADSHTRDQGPFETEGKPFVAELGDYDALGRFAHSPRPPMAQVVHSPNMNSVEMDGSQHIAEIQGSPLSSPPLSADGDIHNHPLYPHSRRVGPLRSNSEVTTPPRDLSQVDQTSTGKRTIDSQLHSSDHASGLQRQKPGGEDDEVGPMLATAGPLTDFESRPAPKRPGHDRHNSSMSSGLTQLPSPASPTPDENRRQSQIINDLPDNFASNSGTEHPEPESTNLSPLTPASPEVPSRKPVASSRSAYEENQDRHAL